ncbi:hypothetical protein [Neisseria sp. MVDL19-042950]|uniref:hypothetical protein n=1 Tax=Neisseria sp. MVDL19-042950 TaxID=3061169 RepID=UPI00265F3471|nr:hypothetical protein [Neisseria sp. MVDL19-042950]MDO1510476.1 hypothetical protein [Neisseria sp. MVDL19-042950]
MNKPESFYDVYVSYPPGVDHERINACLRDNLPENEANDLIQALSERPQAIIAEYCTNDERENARHYFSFLGLDVIVRRSMELAPDRVAEEEGKTQTFEQCPVCNTIIDGPEVTDYPTCRLHFPSATEILIQRKRIEWEEKVAFEHKKQQEIAHKLLLEKQEEEKRLRKQIRAELEEKLQKELGKPNWRFLFKGKNAAVAGIVIFVIVIILVAAGYFTAHFIR